MTRSISEDEIHLWKFQLSQVHRTNWSVLSRDEQARANEFRFENLRQNYATGRSNLRAILGGYTGLNPQDIRFDYGPAGKPKLHTAHGVQLQFNLSHSGDWAIVAISKTCSIGVDVEQVRDLPDLHGLACQIFSSDELTRFGRLPRQLQQDAYFDCWTQKESILKGLGSGFSFPVHSIEVQVDPRAAPQILKIGRTQSSSTRWQLTRIDVARGYRACLAIQSESSKIRLIAFDYVTEQKPQPTK